MKVPFLSDLFSAKNYLLPKILYIIWAIFFIFTLLMIPLAVAMGVTSLYALLGIIVAAFVFFIAIVRGVRSLSNEDSGNAIFFCILPFLSPTTYIAGFFFLKIVPLFI